MKDVCKQPVTSFWSLDIGLLMLLRLLDKEQRKLSNFLYNHFFLSLPSSFTVGVFNVFDVRLCTAVYTVVFNLPSCSIILVALGVFELFHFSSVVFLAPFTFCSS